MMTRLLLFLLVTATNASIVRVLNPVDPDLCLASLLDSDVNGDGQVQPEEYVEFARDLAPPGFFDETESYDELPFAMKSAFNGLACRCQNEPGASPDCCYEENAGVRIPTDLTDTEEMLYLNFICRLTRAAALSIYVPPDPTSSPTGSPSTLFPTVLPTTEPTSSPTGEPTVPPTDFPTGMPIVSPTELPTGLPTMQPTVFPTGLPSQVPTEEPTTAQPTGTPTSAPTGMPVNVPVADPTSMPTTLAPSDVPTMVTPTATPTTIEPSSFPSMVTPTAGPTTAQPVDVPVALPTPAPTTQPIVVYEPTASPTPGTETSVQVEYAIGIRNGAVDKDTPNFMQSWMSDLVVAMDDVALGINLGRRRLQEAMRLILPCEVEPSIIPCPPDTSIDNECYNVTSTVRLVQAVPDEAVVEEFRMALNESVYNGLEGQLLMNNPETPIYFLGLISGEGGGGGDDGGREVESSNSLGTLPLIGIGVGVFAVLAGIAFFAVKGNGQADDQNKYAEYRGEDESKARDASADPSNNSSGQFTDSALQLVTDAAAGTSTLGATQADYGKKKMEAMEAGEDLVAEPAMFDDGSSSNAGSSGWSSSAGVSSLNTGSVDDNMDIAAAAGATLASMGVASGLSRNMRGDRSDDDMPQASRDHLDNLIEAGDWAAVGATAALLAAASDSQSLSSRSRGTTRSRDSTGLDAQRAAELDTLVDAGDWEGVVLAAAKYQTAEITEQQTGASLSVESSADSLTNTATGTGGSPSLSTSLSDSPSKAAKRSQTRQEVEELVRRVVPEEIDNVDEMMNQFKGREEELVETLRTMQERAVAQKARAAGHKAAKVKAKRNVQRGVVPGVPSVSGSTLSSADVDSALDKAVEQGDWTEVARVAQSLAGDKAAVKMTPKKRELQGEAAEKVSAVDELIKVGDWTGVYEVANQYSEGTKKSKSRLEREEEEALAMAEEWMKISERTKLESTDDAGAHDAAEWAIQRSLSQMNQAEKSRQADDEEETEV